MRQTSMTRFKKESVVKTPDNVPVMIVWEPRKITKQKVLEFVDTETSSFIYSRCHSVFSQMACKMAAKDLKFALQQHLPESDVASWSKLLDSKSFRAKLASDFNISFIQRVIAEDSISEMYAFVVSQLRCYETWDPLRTSIVKEVKPMYEYVRKEKLKKSIETKRALYKRRAPAIRFNGNHGTI